MLSFLKELIVNLPIDLRAEVLVVDLIRKGFAPDDLFLRPVGLFKRRFGRDIEELEDLELKDGSSVTVMNLNREGIYDCLPENIFHHPPAGKPKAFKGVEEMVADVKRRMEEEKQARHFFLIYEAGMLEQRLVNEWQERRLLDSITFGMDDDKLLSYLHLPSSLSKRQKGMLFYLFPVIYKIRGNIKLMEAVYSVILGEKVEITRQVKKLPTPKALNSPAFLLGSVNLALTSVLGESSGEYFECYSFNVSLEDFSRTTLYLPGGAHAVAMEVLHGYFMPFYAESEVLINISPRKWVMKKENPNESRLGYGVVL